ncbi:hypothetical protein SLS63_012126 [Diaporthe eres]|uniref:Ubiquitin-like domain-containing protein n=1 Tax=Diaporthe eres TaxID=83184 RepID=A0ABR1NS73_DIAER
MATPGFGSSAGDFIAGVSLIKKLIRALNDTAGSRAPYRKLISELLNLEDALTDISKLRLGQAQESQGLSLRRVAMQCESSIEAFLQKKLKFNESLGTQPCATPSAWRMNLHKIQWALCKDTAIDDLRTEIAAHTATLNITLATIQVEANALAEQNRQTLVAHTGMMETFSRVASGLVVWTQEDGLLSLVRKGLQWHSRIFDAVTQMQQVLCSIPPQIEREQPVLFEDAHGRLTPFHVEFINSHNAFQAVLEARFENMPGLRKVRNLDENPDCRMVYRRITEVNGVKPGKRKRSDPHGSPEKRMKQGHKDNGTDEDYQEGIREFRRVQIIHMEPSSSTERLVSPEDTTGRCVKDVYHNVYDNGESDITEQLHACRPGHICSDPIVREYDRKISSRGSPLIDPTDLRYPDDINDADNGSMFVSAGRFDLSNAVRSPSPESDGYYPGWTPEATFDWEVPVL